MDNEARSDVSALTCSQENRYTVKKGDTMTSIARANGISLNDLLAANPYVSPNVLIVGQVICLPEKEEETPSEPSQPTEPSEPTQPENPPSTGDSQQPETPEEDQDSCVGQCCRLCPQGWERGEVQLGESYADLLVRYDISYRAMRIANPRLIPGLLIPGQNFCIPPEEDRHDACPAGSQSYQIQAGENLQSVAQKLNVSVGRLLRSNPSLSPSEFAEGQVICLERSTPCT